MSMRAFAELLDRLALTPSRNGKLALLERYFREAEPADAGTAIALLAGALEIRTVTGAAIRDLARSRIDPVLFDLSYTDVGDQAETVALLWPGRSSDAEDCGFSGWSDWVRMLQTISKKEALERVAAFLDRATPTERWACLKLVTGASLRIGVSARLAKTALARAWGRNPDDLEKIWNAFQPPYEELFRWLREGTDAPEPGHRVYFHPPLLAQALDENELESMPPEDFAAEWKWDGIRVQLASNGGDQRRLYSRSGDEISAAFPEVLRRADFDAVVDGELLVRSTIPRNQPSPFAYGDIAPFARLQQRLNRKKVTPALLRDFPVLLCVYDLLFLRGEDLRALPWSQRRQKLEALAVEAGWNSDELRLSPLIEFHDWGDLRGLRAQSRQADLEGLMVKRKDSPYVPGRPKGYWFKWKRQTLNVDAVLMYAQRGHGKRASFYSDYTFGLWRAGAEGRPELVPVGKAYSGFTDAELSRLDRWIREHTLERFGSVRSVAPGLVLEVEFDAVQRSTRHKSGLAMRFPRIQRIRWDKPVQEAGNVADLAQWVAIDSDDRKR